MAKLIILRGNSGSGKTAVSKALPLLINLLEYGRKNSEITILEGILDAECYRPLFQKAIEEYGTNIFAFYYDLPFEETLLRHSTKPNKDEFGEEAMRNWWKEKDYINIIPERILTKDIGFSDTVDMIYQIVSEAQEV